MESNNSIKEYYFKIVNLYNNCVNMLTAINQSLVTNSPQVIVNVTDQYNNITEMKIPSFLYLENRLEELYSSFENFFNIPNSGDAWFENNSNMYKFHLIKANTSPQTPVLQTNNIFTSFTDNNYFKDLVSPKTYIKVNVGNLTNNIEKIFIKKYIFNTATLFETVKQSNVKTNEELIALLYNFTKGIDYDVYDSIIDLPLKKEIYNSRFNIVEIVNESNLENPWVDNNLDGKEKLHYKLRFDTLEYHNQEDRSITFTLKVGDFICLNNTNSLYRVKEVNTANNIVIIEEYIGHTAIQSINENSDMYFTIYNNNYSEYNYIDIPLEENQYIGLFIGTIYNNIRSILSEGVYINLDEIYMKDEYGNFIFDDKGNKVSYMTYYKTYCKNIGDILSGFSDLSNPLLSEYTPNEIEELKTSESIKELVNNSFNGNDILQVVPINKHLIDDKTTQEIINLHNQKNELNNKLNTINTNIDDLYNQLTNTDWTQQVSNSQLSIRKKLDEFYVERTQITTQINNVIDSINAKSVVKYDQDLKYRIRGILDTETLEKYISDNYNKAVIIGIDINYKYKSEVSTTTSLTSINTSTFTDWNKYDSNDKERLLSFNSFGNVVLEWENTSKTENSIKWNQVDIPITQNEQVIIRVRYKYNIGQPFINLYTPWSDEETIVFPEEYKEMVEISQIINKNSDDTIVASFNKTLINDGYTDHVSNKMISSNQVFYHMPENIYSGFNTSENNLLSLKDKLNLMNNDIEKYKDMINDMLLRKYSVYLEFDNEIIELFAGTINKVNINDTSLSDKFVKKNMRVVIKNKGENPIKLYSQFPGNMNIMLLEDNRESYAQYIGDYERVPLIINNEMAAQSLGQWIYFRQNNPYTREDIYLNTESQRLLDKSALTSNLSWEQTFNGYIQQDNSQILYPYKAHGYYNVNLSKNVWQGLYYDESKTSTNPFVEYVISKDWNESNESSYADKNFNNFYHYTNVENNNIYLMRYEDIMYNNGSINIFLDENTSINDFNNNGESYLHNSMVDYNGGFFYPNIDHRNNIIVDYSDINPNNYVSIDPGNDLSVPLVFEYCLGNTTNNIQSPLASITKSLYFDIKDSLFNDPKTYMIEVTINSNYQSLNNYLDKLSILEPEGE